MLNHITRMAMLGTVLGLTACASADREPPVRIAVTSTPAGSSCEATRDNQIIGRVAATPGILRVTNSSSPILLTCESASHAPGRAIVPSVADGATAGIYFLAGGLIGLAAASATGAMYTYPADVAVTLVPQEFRNAGERDAFIDTLVTRVRQQATGQSSTQLHDAEVERLERIRQAARVIF